MTLAGILLTTLLLVALTVGLARPDAPRALRWFGRLPGDVRIERPGVRFYLPITSMLLVSLGLTLLLGGLSPILGLLGRAVSWFGRLPGDFVLEVGGGVLIVPLASMLVLSVVATLVANLVRWLGRRSGKDDPPDPP